MGGGVPPPIAGPVATAASSATPIPVGEATVAALPEKLRDLQRAVVVTGTVAGETANGLTRIRTQAGEVLLKSPVALLLDKPVTLQIGAGQPPATATVLAPPSSLAAPSVTVPQAKVTVPGGTGAPQAPATTGTAPPSLPIPAAALPSSPAPTAPLLPGTLLPAVVLAVARNAPTPMMIKDAAPSPSPSPGSAAPAGSPAPGAMAGASTAGAATAAPSSPMTTGASQPPPPTLAAPSTGGGEAAPNSSVSLGGDAAHPDGETSPAAAPSPSKGDAPPRSAALPNLTPGATVAVKVLSVALPPSSPTAAPGPQADAEPTQEPPPTDLPDGAVVVRGTVAGTTSQGQPILATRLGMLALGTNEPVPRGTVVTAAISDPGVALKGIIDRDVFLAASREWPALREALVALAGIDRTLAQSLVNTLVPQPNRRMTAAVSFFLSAVRGGDARAWLGEEASNALERRGRGDLLEALEREFRGMQQQASDPLPGTWHGFTVPVFDGAVLQPVRLHIHPVRDDEEGADPEREQPVKGSRFIIDLDLSRLGPLQLDGMVRDRRFDLILRSRAALPPALRDELTGVFANSVSAVGFSGGLVFQADVRQWVKLARAGSRLGVTA